jgi:ABC-type nitrate/sulfonate/bicarbonate transport system substrate-binding protein
MSSVPGFVDRVILRFGIAAVAIALSGWTAQAADTVRLLTARPGWQAGMAWDAKDRGLWQKYNLDVQHTSLDTSAAAMEGFVSGRSDIAIVNVGVAVNAFFRGVPIRIIAGAPASDYPAFTMSPDIKELKDLKGRKIAVFSIPSDATIAIDFVLQKQGLLPNRDYTYVRVPAPNICEALKRNQADMGVVFEPHGSACMLQGAKQVGGPGAVSFDPPKLIPSSVLVINAQFLEQNRDVAVRFLKAAGEAVAWAGADKAGAVAQLAKYTGEPEPAIAASYDAVRFSLNVDLSFHKSMLERYVAVKLLTREPTQADLDKLYQLDMLPR